MDKRPDVMIEKDTKAKGVSGKKVPKRAIWMIGGVAVAVIVLVIGICNGAFLSRRNKILLATRNTLKDMPQVVQNMTAADIIASGKYTIGVKADINGKDFDGTFKREDTQLQAMGTFSISGSEDIGFLASLDEEQLSTSIPALTDDLLVYNYREEKDGYIVDLLGEEGIASLDSALSELSSKKERNKAAQEILSVIYDEYKKLDIKKAEKAEFKVDGRVRKCSGCEFTVTEDDFLRVIDKIEDIYGEYYRGAADLLERNIGDGFSKFKSEAYNMGDITVKVYVYRNKLAAVVTEAETSDVTYRLLFQGGEYRLQNLELLAGDSHGEHSVFELRGKTKEAEGAYEVSIDNEGRNISLAFSISKDVQFEKMSGDILDVGSMSESDLRKFVLRVVGTIIASHIR